MSKKGGAGSRVGNRDTSSAELAALLTAPTAVPPSAKQKTPTLTALIVKDVAIKKKPSITEIAQSLRAVTNFIDFVYAGHGTTMLFDGVIFGYVVEMRDGQEFKGFTVQHSETAVLKKGFTVSSGEVIEYAEVGSRYCPSMQEANVELENMHSCMINTLLSAIDQAGGHHAVVRTIEMKRRQERNHVESKARAKKIIADIQSGELSGDLMSIFDTTQVNTIGVVFGGKPMVLRSGRKQIGQNPGNQRHAVAVLSDPMSFCRQGTVVALEYLFQQQRYQPAEVLAGAIRSVLTGNYLAEAKTVVISLGGTIPGEVAPQLTSTTVPATGTLQ